MKSFNMQLHFELVTPERVVFTQDVDRISLPTSEGEITILPHHIPLVTMLSPGVIQLKRGAVIEDVAVSGGFIQVMPGNHVRVLADTAERGIELDMSVVETAKKRAEQLMREAVRVDDNSYALAAAALERELARYRVVRKRASRRTPTIESSSISSNENSV